MVRWSHRCPWKAISQVFEYFSPYIRLVVGSGQRIRFWEDLWSGEQPLSLQFASLYIVTSVRNLTISEVLGGSYPSSWNLSFRHNLTDQEIEMLERLMFSLNEVRLSSSIMDSRGWCLSSTSSFSVKSFFMALSKSSNLIPFLSVNFIWKSKASLKVKVVA